MISPNSYKILRWSFQDYHILYLIYCNNLANLYHILRRNFTSFSEEWPSYFISRAPKSKCGELTEHSEIAIFWPFSNVGLHSLSNLQTQFQIICLYYKKTTCAQTIAWFEAKSHILAWLSDPAVKTFVPSYKTKDSFIKYVSQFHAILA